MKTKWVLAWSKTSTDTTSVLNQIKTQNIKMVTVAKMIGKRRWVLGSYIRLKSSESRGIMKTSPNYAWFSISRCCFLYAWCILWILGLNSSRIMSCRKMRMKIIRTWFLSRKFSAPSFFMWKCSLRWKTLSKDYFIWRIIPINLIPS
jgi:hypothetical protein